MKELVPVENLREEIKEKVVKVFADYLDTDANTSVGQAQIEAYQSVVDQIPEGKLKEFAEGLKSLQEKSSKFNEAMVTAQDKIWKLARVAVISKIPLAGLIPEDPFSKIAIKSASLGGKMSGALVRTVNNVAQRVRNKKQK